MEPALAIDGDESTRWGGAFSPGQWLQVDLSRTATIGGVLIHWDSAFAGAYLILSSEDGQHWQTAYETADSQGGRDYVLFPAVRARYLRLVSGPHTTDWGVSVFEFEPLAARESPRITGLKTSDDPAALWSARRRPASSVRVRALARELHVRLPRALPVSGLEVFWASARREARLEGRSVSGQWRRAGGGSGRHSGTARISPRESPAPSASCAWMSAAPGHACDLAGCMAYPTQALTTMKRYQIAAARAHRELFPSSLHDQQVYWTAVGVPAAHRKSVFDEYGDLPKIWRRAARAAAVA